MEKARKITVWTIALLVLGVIDVILAITDLSQSDIDTIDRLVSYTSLFITGPGSILYALYTIFKAKKQ